MIVESALYVYKTLVVHFCACAVALNSARMRETGEIPESPIRVPKTQSAFHPHAQRKACSHRCDHGQHCSLNRWTQTALSNSRNALSISSACTIKRFPSSRCASTIQIVHPAESMAETQPRLHPAALSLSAMISQYFTGTAAAFSDCSARFAVRLCSLRVVRSLSAAPQ